MLPVATADMDIIHHCTLWSVQLNAENTQVVVVHSVCGMRTALHTLCSAAMQGTNTQYTTELLHANQHDRTQL